MVPPWPQKKPFPAPHSRRPLPGAIFLAPSGMGLFSLQMLPPWRGLPSHSLPSPSLLPSHYLASLVACLLPVFSLWNRSFTSPRPGCLGRSGGLSKAAVRSASLHGCCGLSAGAVACCDVASLALNTRLWKYRTDVRRWLWPWRGLNWIVRNPGFLPLFHEGYPYPSIM